MKKLPKQATYTCSYCQTLEIIPDLLDNIKLKDITYVYCPTCLAKGKRRKMKVKVEE